MEERSPKDAHRAQWPQWERQGWRGEGGHGQARSSLQGSQINLTAAMQDCGLGWHSQTLPDVSKEATYLQFHVEFPKPPNPSWAKQNTSVGET